MARLPWGDPLHAGPQVVQRAGSQDGGHLHGTVGQDFPWSFHEVEDKFTQTEALLVLMKARWLGGSEEKMHEHFWYT